MLLVFALALVAVFFAYNCYMPDGHFDLKKGVSAAAAAIAALVAYLTDFASNFLGW